MIELDPKVGPTKDVTAFLYNRDLSEGALPENAREMYAELSSKLNKKFEESLCEADHKFYLGLLYCMQRLDAVLLQISRVSEYADAMEWEIEGKRVSSSMPPESFMAVAAKEIYTDFESLLFHARAVLDRLTLSVSRQYRNNSDRFSKIKNLLRDASVRDVRASTFLKHVKSANTVQRVLTDTEGKKSLRSIITHRGSISEGVLQCFTLCRQKDGKFLALDCEAYGYPILGTTFKLAAEIPYLVLNGIAVYSGLHPPARLEIFTPVWRTQAISYTEYIDPDKKGPLICVSSKFIPNGIQVTKEHVKHEIFENSFSR